MGSYFDVEWAGEPFRLFDATHVALLATVAAVTALALVVGPRLRPATRRAVRRTAAAILVLNTVGWHVWNVAVGTWNIQTMLPLHLCSVMSLVAAVALWTGHAWLGTATFLLGSPGALQALLTPEVAPYGFPHYRVLQSWTQHGVLWVAGFWCAFVEGCRPTLRSTVQVWGALHALAAVIFVVNLATGGNYLFLNRKPEFASVLDLLPPWPAYLLVLEALVVVVLLAFWLIARRWRPAPGEGQTRLQSGVLSRL